MTKAPDAGVGRVRVDLADRGYDIEIGTGNLAAAGELAAALRRPGHACVITDANVAVTHAAAVEQSLAHAGWRTSVIVVEAGEKSKSPEIALGVWNDLLAVGADRGTLVVAVGGGVVGDLAGFVAATFARGVELLQVPTTLLAQVDSSVGGKVGVNLPAAKNMVGAIWQPLGVLIDTAVLDTLPEREYCSGLAEVVKYGVILDADFFAWLEQHAAAISARRPDVLQRLIARCCQLKAAVVREDEREVTGRRAVLNYGHTFAHAFETLTGYGTLLHGEAVAAGMVCASRLAERLGRIGEDVTRRQRDLLKRLGLRTAPPQLPAEDVLAAMGSDKKARGGQIRFVLPTRMGHVELVDDVPLDEVRAVLAGKA